MNLIEAVEQLKSGKAIRRSSWGDAASGNLTPEMLVLLSGDYEATTGTEET